MNFTQEQQDEILDVMREWMEKKRFTADDATNKKILQKVANYLQGGDVVSVSHFERAYVILVDKGEIAPFSQSLNSMPAPEPLIPADVVAYIESASAFEQHRRYRNDPVFRKHYDAYTASKEQAPVQAEEPLTADAYHRMSAGEVIRRYRADAKFKAGVDSLVARGLI